MQPLERLFAALPPLTPSADFLALALARIAAEEARLARRRAALFASGALASFGVTVATVAWLAASLSRTGFYAYVSLAFSGDASVYAFSKELFLSIGESIPVVGVIALLAVLAVFLWTSANAVTGARSVRFA